MLCSTVLAQMHGLASCHGLVDSSDTFIRSEGLRLDSKPESGCTPQGLCVRFECMKGATSVASFGTVLSNRDMSVGRKRRLHRQLDNTVDERSILASSTSLSYSGFFVIPIIAPSIRGLRYFGQARLNWLGPQCRELRDIRNAVHTLSITRNLAFEKG